MWALCVHPIVHAGLGVSRDDQSRWNVLHQQKMRYVMQPDLCVAVAEERALQVVFHKTWLALAHHLHMEKFLVSKDV